MKAYVKPDVCYEDFQLSTHIARCEYQTTATGESCSVIMEGTALSTLKENCQSLLESYCYTGGPNDGKIIFMS